MSAGKNLSESIAFQPLVEALEDRRLLSAVLVKDLNGNTLDSDPSKITAVGSTAYFLASNPSTGRELYKSDSKTVTLVKDLTPGAANSNIYGMTALGTLLIFSTESSVWKTDGTAAGTTILKNDSGSFFTTIGSKTYFSSSDPATGTSGLWVTDGTVAGTKVVKDNLSISAQGIFAVGSRLYFGAYVPGTNYGMELHTSDGTAAGTKLVKDIVPGTGSSVPQNFAGAGGKLVFVTEQPSGIYDFYKTDGTTTTLIKSNYHAQNLVGIGNAVYFTYFGALWKLDVNTNTITTLNNPSPRNMTAVGSKLFFQHGQCIRQQ